MPQQPKQQHTHRRIVQIMAPAVPMTIVWFMDDDDPIATTPIVALALVNEWQSPHLNPTSAEPESDTTVERRVMPMTIDEDTRSVELETATNILTILTEPLTPELRTQLEDRARKASADKRTAQSQNS